MEDDIKAAFGRVWPAHVANLTRYIIACRKAFDGDLDLFLVLAVIGERTFSGKQTNHGIDYKDFQAGRGATEPDFDINLRSIAAFSGIPRETARRKLAELEKRGWISRDGNGNLRATARAATDLEPLTEAGIQYVASMLSLLNSAIPAEPASRTNGAARED